MLRLVHGQVSGLLVGLAFGVALVVGGVIVTLSVVGAQPSRGGAGDGDATVPVCVSLYTGQARYFMPGQAPNCTEHERPLDLASGDIGGDLGDLEARIDALEAENTALQAELAALETQVPDCLSDDGGTALFSGCDVQIVNGEGSTNSANGTGNLIVGYNENAQSFARPGSHNLVVGRDHGYESFGGLVVGFRNVISGAFASVTGGADNTASANHTIVSGGSNNTAIGVGRA